MINFLLLMIIPIAIAVVSIFVFKGKVTLPEFGAQLGVPALAVGIALSAAYCQSTSDIEVWNGRITSKVRDEVSCRHSYQCNCVTTCSGSGSNETCTTICQTCWEHSYDVDWNIFASTGEGISIDTIDRQGLRMPPRWGAAFVGEPFSSAHRYTNYILANPESVLLGGKGDVERFKGLIPTYPQVYDYYRTNHVVNMGVPLQDQASWEWLMDEVNGDLGPVKQVQILLMFVKTAEPKYILALKDAWVGGKKNDSLVVIGSEDGRRISFADVVSWTPNQIYKIRLKDDIQKIGTLQKRDDIVKAIRFRTQNDFKRMKMSDYEYLAHSFQPSATVMMWLFILSALLSLGIAAFCILNDEEDYDIERKSWKEQFYWR